MSSLPRASFGSPDKPLIIGEAKIQCYVLNNKKRVLVLGEMIRALGMKPGSAGKGGNDRLASFASGIRVKPFIPNELMAMIENPIKFKPPTGGIAYGYEATILADICKSIIEARKNGVLQKQQAHIGERAEMLISAFAKVGIIALVDEATGFQEVRDKDALKNFLEKFLLEERGKWVKTFPDQFFEMIFKMKGWTWHFANSGKKPQVVGHYVNDFVYSRIAPQVLKELRELNPTKPHGGRSFKHTQYISPDYGHPKLKEHLAALIALGRGAGFNWNNFKRLIERAFPKFSIDGSAAPELGFPEDVSID
jgi:hypothetical protein